MFFFKCFFEIGKNPELAAFFYWENHRIKRQGNPKGFHHQFQPSEVPLIGVHGATHHGLAQAIGRGHEDHVFEAALRVQGEPQGELKGDYQHGCRVLFHTQSHDQTLLGILWLFPGAKKTRCNPRTRMQSRRTVLYISPVTVPVHCRLWNVEPRGVQTNVLRRMWSGDREVWSVKCRVWDVKCEV